MNNIIAINTANSGGGAEKVAYDLVRLLHLRGYHSRMMVKRIDYSADPLAKALLLPVPGSDLLYSAGNFLDERLSTQYLFYLPTWKIPFMRAVYEADVVHLHNIHGYYFNILTLPLLASRKPIVWTLHDMWPFTGKCVHAFGCDGYMNSCGNCPQLAAYPILKRDTTRFHLRLKKLLFSSPGIRIVAPSEWMRGHINRSVLRNHTVDVIPSPVDTEIFFPGNKTEAREKLGIPEDKKVLLFIASWINSIPSKGISLFLEMVRSLLAKRDDVYTLIVGHLENQSVLSNEFPGKETGWISDPVTMRHCYVAADLFISPTLAENSSCTIAESMACGTPPVAFAVGGVPEQIIDAETGALVAGGNIQQLVGVVEKLLANDEVRRAYGAAAAERARRRYSLQMFTDKYLAVYEAAVSRSHN